MKVIITGAAAGIGFSIAQKLAARGEQLLLVDKNEDELEVAAAKLSTYEGRVFTHVADLRDASVFGEIVIRAATLLGGITGVVSNAGATFPGPLNSLSLEDYENSFLVNTRPTWLLARAAYGHLVESKGALVALSSIGSQYPSAKLGSYSASKAALVALIAQMAVEWGAVGVRCNCVSPGATLTSMYERHFPAEADRRRHSSVVPLGRLALPEDIANGVAFLLGTESAFVSGANLVIDGGFTKNLLQLSAENS